MITAAWNCRPGQADSVVVCVFWVLIPRFYCIVSVWSQSHAEKWSHCQSNTCASSVWHAPPTTQSPKPRLSLCRVSHMAVDARRCPAILTSSRHASLVCCEFLFSRQSAFSILSWHFDIFHLYVFSLQPSHFVCAYWQFHTQLTGNKQHRSHTVWFSS